MRLLFLIALFAGLSAHAKLEWEQKEVKVNVHATQLSADAVFHFSNTGTAPDSLADIRVSCGCLSPKPTKRIYAPGENGELVISLDLRNRTGKQRKAFAVTSDDGSATQLFVEVNIPEVYTMAPILVVWPKGTGEKSKTSRLVNPNPNPIRLLSATSSNADFPVELKVIREGFEYEVVVSRLTAASNVRSVIRIATEIALGQTESKILKLYVHAQ
ncbi:MAG: DUF1573 domain-containing protein [Pontiella sp.]